MKIEILFHFIKLTYLKIYYILGLQTHYIYKNDLKFMKKIYLYQN